MADQSPEPRGRAARWLRIGAFIVLIVGGLIGGTYVYLQSRFALQYDKGWIDEQRLTMPPCEPVDPSVADFGPYDEAAREWEAVASALSPTAPAFFADYASGLIPLEEVQPFLDHYGGVLARIREGARHPRAMRHDPASVADDFPRCAKFAVFAGLVCAQTIALHERGLDGEALSVAADGFALSSDIQRHGGIDALLTGLSCGEDVEEAATRVLYASRLSRREYLAYAQRIRRVKEGLEPLSSVVAFEYERWREWSPEQLPGGRAGIADVAAHYVAPDSGPLPRIDDLGYMDGLHCYIYARSFELDPFMEWMEDRYARYAREVAKPWGQADVASLDRETEADIAERNDLLAHLFEPARLGQVYDWWLVYNSRLIGQQAAAALMAYRADRGELPGDLEALVPEYLPDVPVDPFTGKAAGYGRTRDGCTLYSAGPNRRDDGGSRQRGDVPGHLEMDVVILPPRPVVPPMPTPE